MSLFSSLLCSYLWYFVGRVEGIPHLPPASHLPVRPLLSPLFQARKCLKLFSLPDPLLWMNLRLPFLPLFHSSCTSHSALYFWSEELFPSSGPLHWLFPLSEYPPLRTVLVPTQFNMTSSERVFWCWLHSLGPPLRHLLSPVSVPFLNCAVTLLLFCLHFSCLPPL